MNSAVTPPTAAPSERTEPKIEWVGDVCRIWWESRKLLLTLSRMRETSGGLVADSELWHEPAGLLDFGTLNLHSRSGREGLRSEEHTSELQSQSNLVCRLLLEKKKKKNRRCCIASW